MCAQGLVKCRAVMGSTQIDGLLLKPVNKLFCVVCPEQEGRRDFSSESGTGKGQNTEVNCVGTNILETGKGGMNRLRKIGATWDLWRRKRWRIVKSVWSIAEVQIRNKGKEAKTGEEWDIPEKIKGLWKFGVLTLCEGWFEFVSLFLINDLFLTQL